MNHESCCFACHILFTHLQNGYNQREIQTILVLILNKIERGMYMMEQMWGYWKEVTYKEKRNQNSHKSRSTFSSVQFICSVVSDSLQPHESQHSRPPCPSPSPWVHSDSHPSSPWCHPAISSSVVPSPPAPNPSQHQSLFQWVNPSHEVAKVLELQL